MSRFTYEEYIEQIKNTATNVLKQEVIKLYGNTKNYEIERNLYFETIEKASEEAKRIYDRAYYMLNKSKKKERYEKVSIFIGISENVGYPTTKMIEKTKGRPKHIIIGSKEKPHIHIVVLGNNASKFCNDIVKKLNKHNDKKIFDELKKRFRYYENMEKKHLLLYRAVKLKEDNSNGVYYLSYIYNQSKIIYSAGYLKKKYGGFFVNKKLLLGKMNK